MLVYDIAEEKEEITDEVIINNLNDNLIYHDKLNLEISLQDIERMHRIGEPKKTGRRTRPIIVKLVRYNDRDRVFRNKKGSKRVIRYQLLKALRKQRWIN